MIVSVVVRSLYGAMSISSWMALGIPPLLGMAWGYSTEAGGVRLIMA